MKSLYTYLINEARGLLREQYDYTNIASFVTDIIISNFDQLSSHVVRTSIVDNEVLKSVYPEWIGEVRLFTHNRQSDSIAFFEPDEAKYVDGKLEFDIYVNLNCVRKKSSNNYTTKISQVVMRRLIEQALQHEFKHAFDEWIHQSKNIKIDYQKYFSDRALLKYVSVPADWAYFLQNSHYILSKYETTANQQSLIHFYKHTSIGRLYIKVIKARFASASKMLDYIDTLNFHEYKNFTASIVNDICKVLNNEITPDEISIVIKNPYIDNFWMINYISDKLKSTSDSECDYIMSKIEVVDFHGFKVPKTGNSRERLQNIFSEIKRVNTTFLTKRVLNRLYR